MHTSLTCIVAIICTLARLTSRKFLAHDAIENGMLDGEGPPGLSNTAGRIGFIGHGDVLSLHNNRVESFAD